jgi:anti-sigma B factor antagonist
MDTGTAPVPSLTLSAWTAGSTTIAELHGELDITCSPALRDQLLGLLRRSSSRLVVDLSGVTYCDASGLAVLVGTERRARLLGGSLRLAAVPPQVDEVLHITGLDRHLDVFPSVQAATAGQRPDLDSTIGAAPRQDRARRVLPGSASGRVLSSPDSADFGTLREVTAALLAQSDAWRDADPRRRFAPVLRTLARACRGSDDIALETAARSLMSVLRRHPLAHSHAVAASATCLRRVLDNARSAAVA